MKKLKKLSSRLSANDQRRRREKIWSRRRIRVESYYDPAECNYKPSWWTRLLRFFLIRKPVHE